MTLWTGIKKCERRYVRREVFTPISTVGSVVVITWINLDLNELDSGHWLL